MHVSGPFLGGDAAACLSVCLSGCLPAKETANLCVLVGIRRRSAVRIVFQGAAHGLVVHGALKERLD